MLYMKKSLFPFALAFSLLLLAPSCSDKKQQPALSPDDMMPTFVFDNQDSLAIQALADDFLARVNANDFESAADLLYTVHNDSVSVLTAQERAGYINAMKAMPQFGFVQQELLLFSDRDNELRLAVKLSEDADVSKKQGIIRFVLNPVEVDGQWYLTLRDEYAEGVGDYH